MYSAIWDHFTFLAFCNQFHFVKNSAIKMALKISSVFSSSLVFSWNVNLMQFRSNALLLFTLELGESVFCFVSSFFCQETFQALLVTFRLLIRITAIGRHLWDNILLFLDKKYFEIKKIFERKFIIYKSFSCVRYKTAKKCKMWHVEKWCRSNKYLILFFFF